MGSFVSYGTVLAQLIDNYSFKDQYLFIGAGSFPRQNSTSL
jgi:hypothetical protein